MKTTSITSSHIYSAQRRTRTISRTHQHGLTLIEVMISVTISLILLAGVMQIFTSSRQTYTVQDSMGRLQENGRFALSFLTRDVRMSDYWGCLENTATLVNNLNPAGAGYSAALHGFGSGIAGTNTGDGVGLQDSITLRMAVPAGLTIQNPMNNNAANIQVSLPNTLAPGQIVIISNCTNGDIFQISAGNPGVSGTVPHAIGGVFTPGNCSPLAPPCSGNLSAVYGTDAQLMSAQTITYSIVNDAANNNEPTLFQSVNGAAAVALVEGVENMQILYGEDTDMVFPPPALPLPNGDRSANRYVAAGTAGLNMRRVVSVRIGLVLRTKENNLATSVQSYNFNGAVVTPADRRLRRIFSTTIGLRNRGA